MPNNFAKRGAWSSGALLLALAVAACQSPVAGTATNGEPSLGQRAGARATRGDVSAAIAPDAGGVTQAMRATGLGLLPSSQLLQNAQFQILDHTGAPLKGAQLVVGDALLTADEQGLVNLPAEVAQLPQVPAVAQAKGFVAQQIDIVPGYAFKMTPVDSARMDISAAGGGVVTNSTGNMTVIFPPGALTGDASVAVTRLHGEDGVPGQRLPEEMPFKVSTQADSKDPLSLTEAGYKLADNLPLGTYHYALDLGEGVQLAPGAAVTVKFKAEGRMAALLKARHENGDNFNDIAEAIAPDAEGNFWLSMRVDGPPVASSITLPAQRRLMNAACDTYSDVQTNTFQVKKEWASLTPGIEVPIWKGGHRTSNNISANWVNSYSSIARGGCTNWSTAFQYENNNWKMQKGSSIPGWITLVTHHPHVNGGRCIYYQFNPEQYYCSGGKIYVKDPGYEWQTTYTTWVSKSINALVTWLSDDPRVTGAISGARVYFNHSLSVMRQAPLVVNTSSTGYASTLGLESSSGSATAELPAQAAFTYSSPVSYRVDCRTVPLRIVKNMPRVAIQTTARGTPSGGAFRLLTNRGEFANINAAGGTVKPALPVNDASGNFSAGGAYQASSSEWVEMASSGTTVRWNGSHTLPVSLWVSRPINAKLAYSSDDASLPADHRPASTWGGQAAAGFNVTFAHPQSGYSAKTRQEPLSFTGVSEASTWGIQGSTSTITASRALNGITLQGTATGVVNDTTVSVAIPASLPKLTFNFDGALRDAWDLSYEITAADGSKTTKTTRVNFGSGGASSLAFAIPVEEAVNQPGKHTFQLVSLMSEDGSNRVMAQAASGLTDSFPAVSGVNRGGTYQYPLTLKATFIAPK